jgi:putative membrane protein
MGNFQQKSDRPGSPASSPLPSGDGSNAQQDGSWLSVFARGLMMGVAELVPGVSGGTIAFISGIYYRLLAALVAFGPLSVPMLRQPRRFWQHHQLAFLLTLGAGMAVGIVLFARLIGFLFEAAAPVLWAFFFGVIAVSVYQIAAARQLRNLLTYGLAGVVLGLGFLSLPAQDFSGSLVALFVAGMVAVCAWILPGISGSFVLLLLGLYADVINAVNSLDWLFLLVLAGGCASGLLLFTRALGWLLEHFQDPLLALLTGFMATALLKLWPWRELGAEPVSGLEGVVAALQWPHQYAQAGQESYLLVALAAGVVGGLGIWLLSKFAPR